MSEISPEKRRARKQMAWLALWTLVVLAIGIFIKQSDLGPNQTQALIALIWVLGGIVGVYCGVTGAEAWAASKFKDKEEK